MADITEVVAKNRWVDIIHPGTQEFMGLRIEVRPESSKEVKAQQRKNSDERLNSRKSKTSAKWLDESHFRVMVAAVADWEWCKDEDGDQVTFEGEQPECTPENVERVFKKLPWIKDQVSEAFNEREAFFTG